MSTALMREESYAGARADRTFSTGVSRALAFVLDALERRRTRRDLAYLDDRMLRDIGLSRYDVEMELRRPWWRG